MTRLPLLLLLLVLSGCPVDGKIDPGTAKAEDLVGYWTHWGAENLDGGGGEPVTVFGFALSAESRREHPLEEFSLDAGSSDTSIVSQAPTFAGGSNVVQVSTFEVKGGAIVQTVLGDVSSLPGTQYSTKIFELTPKQALQLESKNEPSGKRTYEWFERCPEPNAAGWHLKLGQACLTAFSLGTSMIFDRFGDLHAVSGLGAGVGNCQAENFADVGRGCGAQRQASPNFYLSSLAVGPDDVLRMAWNEQMGVSPLHVRERPVRGGLWTDTVIDPNPGTLYDLKLFDDAAGRVLVANGNGPGATLYRWNGATWTRSLATMTDGGAVPITSIARDLDGKLVFARSLPPYVVREGAAGFEPLPLPDAGTLAFASVKVDSRGRLQAVFGGAVVSSQGIAAGNKADLAVLENGAWKKWALPVNSGVWLVPHPDGTPRAVVALGKANKPAFALVTVNGDTLDQELLDVEPPFGGFSIPPHVRTAAEVGPSGEIAATFDGQLIWQRWPQGPLHPRPSQISLLFHGKTGARVVSTDGKIDCSTDCSVPYPGGSRVEVRVVAQPGFAASMSCFEMLVSGEDRCWINVRSRDTQEVVNIVRTPIRHTQQASGANGGAVAFRFGVAGTLTAYGTELNSGATFAVDGVELPQPNRAAAHGMAVFDRSSRSGWHVAMPVLPDAVAPTADGGGWAVVRVPGPTLFGTTLVGSAGTTTVARLRLSPSGEVLGATTMISAAGALTLILGPQQPAAAVQPDGTAAVVLTSTAGFPAQALTDQTVLARIDSAGAVSVVGLDPQAARAAGVVLEGARALVGLQTQALATKLIALDGAGQLTGSRSLPAATLKAVSLRGTRVGVLVSNTSPSNPIDLGGGPRTGLQFAAEYDTTLAFKADLVVPNTTVPIGFALLPEGGAMLFDLARVFRLGPTLAIQGAPDQTNLVAATQVIVLAQDEEGLGALLLLGQGATLLSLKPSPE